MWAVMKWVGWARRRGNSCLIESERGLDSVFVVAGAFGGGVGG